MPTNQPIDNQQYNLVSVVYHTAQGAETCRKYLADAQQSGNQEAKKFLEDACRQYDELARRGLELVKGG
jgi:hypothetical protein